MSTQQIQITFPRQRRADDAGSFVPVSVATEWTPGKQGSTGYIPSTWKDARGPLLTNRRIRHYEIAGRYGPEVQERALRVAAKLAARSITPCIACGSKGTRFYNYSYLAQHGYFCPVCIAIERKAHEADLELKRRYREASRMEYV